jgi:hypothetical protein
MANENPEREGERQIQEEQSKKLYVKPAFQFEKVFVTSALTCGKISDTEFSCLHNRKVS